MDAKRLAVLLAFAGGTLYGAAVITLWHANAGMLPASNEARAIDRSARPSLTSTSDVAQRALPDDTLNAPAAPAHREPSAADEVAQAPTGVAEPSAKEPSGVKESADADGGPAAESGSSVADVLTRLEAAYRQGLVAAAPSDAHTSAPAARATGTEPPAPPPAREEAPLALASAPAPEPARTGTPEPAVAPAEAPRADSVPVVPVPVVASLAAAQPPEATPAPATNISIGTLHQGDSYQVQQVAIMQQYYSFLGASPYTVNPYAGYAPVTPPAASTHHHGTPYAGTAYNSGSPYYNNGSPFSTPPLPQAAPPYPSWLVSLTNPANPMGYHYPHSRGR
jgi:hypothetical protein